MNLENDTTKDKICRTAWTLFQNVGYKNLSLQMVADTCGISRSNIYYYFKRKEDLNLELYRQYVDEFLVIADDATAYISDPWMRFFTAQYAYLKIHTTVPFFRSAYLESATSPVIRSQYIDIKNRLLLHYVDPDKNEFSRHDAYMSSTAISGAEIELLCLYINQPDIISYREAVTYSFRLRLNSLKACTGREDELISSAADQGEEIYTSIFPKLFEDASAPFPLTPSSEH